MNEQAIPPSLNVPRIWEAINFITRLKKMILGPWEQSTRSLPRQDRLDRAHKMIRMAQNYNESYEEVANRIRLESARYKAFKKNPEPIGMVTLNVKHLDSDETCERQYEVKDPAEGKASVTYTRKSSPDVVLEFVLHDKFGLRLFAIARTYSDWIGCEEFDLGGDRTFYLNMVEDEKQGYVSVQAGFKAKEAAVPVLTFPGVTSGTRKVLSKAADSWPFKKMVLVGSAELIVVALCFLTFKVIAKSDTGVVLTDAKQVTAESPTKSVSAPQVTHIILTNLISDFDNSSALGGETGPRKDPMAARSKRASSINALAVSVNSTSLAESVRCGRELINKIQEGVGGKAKSVSATESVTNSTCGNTVKFVVSFEPVERKPGNFLFAFGDDNQPLFNDNYEVGEQGFTGGTDELANILIQIITGHADPRLESDNKTSEVAMTE